VDFYRRVPTHVTVHAARMRLPTITQGDEARMLDEHVMPRAAPETLTNRYLAPGTSV